MTQQFPIWMIAIDYILGVVMWTLIGRFGMRIFLPEESKFFFSRFLILVDRQSQGFFVLSKSYPQVY